MADIRRSLPSELDGICTVENACFSVPWSRKSLEEGIGDERYCFVSAVENGCVVGYGSILVATDECDLLNIAVIPEHRGRGLGKRILEMLVCEAVKRGAASMHLEVRESNMIAVGLYTEFGFTADGIRKNYYTKPQENAVLMTKKL